MAPKARLRASRAKACAPDGTHPWNVYVCCAYVFVRLKIGYKLPLWYTACCCIDGLNHDSLHICHMSPLAFMYKTRCDRVSSSGTGTLVPSSVPASLFFWSMTRSATCSEMTLRLSCKINDGSTCWLYEFKTEHPSAKRTFHPASRCSVRHARRF